MSARALAAEHDDTVTFRIPRHVIDQLASALGAVPNRPLTVDQRTCEQVIGISRRQYLEACRAGAFAHRSEGKRRVARTADVERYWTRDLSTHSRRRAAVSAAVAVEGLSSVGDATDATAEREVAARVRERCRLIPVD